MAVLSDKGLQILHFKELIMREVFQVNLGYERAHLA